MTDDDDVYIRCALVTEVPRPSVRSIRQSCIECGRDVWLSHQTRDRVRQHEPDKAIRVTCMHCIPEGEQEIMHLPEQVQDLRDQGVNDHAIADTLAMAEVSDGLTLEQTAHEITANPTGARGRAYAAAYARAKAFVAGVPR